VEYRTLPPIRSADHHKTVLVIDYFFPPLAGAGPQRTLGFVRYLARYGWLPIVLTVRSGEHNFYDSSLLERIPAHVDVHRAGSVEPIRFAKERIGRRDKDRAKEATPTPSNHGGHRLSRLSALEHWLFFPDRHIGWLPFALPHALSICRRRSVDLVYSTSGTMTSHLIAYAIKKTLRTPWVADFQDPWAQGSVFSFPTPLHRRFAVGLENTVLNNADRITVCADPMRVAFEHRKAGAQGKTRVILSGFDREAFDEIVAVPSLKFTITHFGSFYGSRSPRPFLEALGRCVREHPHLSKELEVLFLGTFDSRLRSLAVELIQEWELQNIVHVRGPVPYKDGLRTLMGSNVLLLIGDSSAWARATVPGKLYEYLATERPILALWPDGPATAIARAAGTALIVPPTDVSAIQQAIWTLYCRKSDRRGSVGAGHGGVARYSWTSLAGELASVFGELVPAAPQGGERILVTPPASDGPTERLMARSTRASARSSGA
jgi:glycosyltransferase involved in cell wall biosynthesis